MHEPSPRFRSRTAVAVGLFAILSCGDGTTTGPPNPPPAPPPSTPPNPPPPPQPASVTVAPGAVRLVAIDETAQLAAEVRDQRGQVMTGAAVAWSSSDGAVAVVDTAGLVRAAGQGTATVTASAGDASNTAEITVAQEVSAIVVSPTAARLGAVGDTVRLVAAPTDANGYPVVDATTSWRSNNDGVAAVDSTGLVRAIGQGTATVTALAGNASGTAEITVAASPDRHALETLYETTGGADWMNRDNWVTSAPVGEWHGVEVDAAGHVVGLALAGNNLTGWIPPEVGDLDRLEYLHIDHNGLTGPLPPELAGATGLTSLRVGDTALSGPLPRPLLALSLEEFHYTDTELCVPPYETFRDWLGGIASHAGTGVECARLTDREILVRLYDATDGPDWENNTNWLTAAPLGEWHGVRTDADGRVWALNLANNGLVGPLPPELGGLSHLQQLDLRGASRRLTGRIPPELGQLGELELLWLSHNALVGGIPPEIGNASSLQYLDLFNNDLTDAIPGELGALTRLEALNLGWNHLSGALPSALGDLARLQRLRLDRNLLAEPIPASLLRLELRAFNFDENPGLCAPGTARFVSWLGRIADSPGEYYCNADDIAVLGRLHESAGGAGWTRSDGWLAGQPLGSWYGVVTDTIGYVRELDLSRNGLVGTLPPELGELAGLTALRIGGNALSGPLPFSLTRLRLTELRYSGTELCVPSGGGLQEWLGTVSSHEGTDLECTASGDRAVLEVFYRSLGGPDWPRRAGWLTDQPLGAWEGVRVNGAGRVVGLTLTSNNLSGRIPADVGNLSQLEELVLSFNPLDGEIPAELARLSNLKVLDLASSDRLRGSIPAELGELGRLETLRLNNNLLTGRIPPALGNLSNLKRLILYQNGLTGDVPPSLGQLSQLENLNVSTNRLGGTIPSTLGNLRNLTNLALFQNTMGGRIPRELGRLVNLKYLSLGDNLLTGKIPRELGGLSRVEVLSLGTNSLTGVIPEEIGDLSRLRRLVLPHNRLAGSIPSELGRLSALQDLDLTHNRDMRGVLPATLTALGQLNSLLLGGTGLCAPREPGFLDWLGGLNTRQVAPCGAVEGSFVYVTQAVQSADFPVPLVAGDEGLLRVFVRADQSTSQTLPDVRASFFLNGTETHTVDIAAQSASIPTEVEEGDLARTANARIPGSVLQPGLEMVVEIDPEGTLDPVLGVAARIPETGRVEVDVRAVPLFALTVIPFLAASDPDSSILEFTRDLNAESDLLRDVNALLPVARLEVNVHEPVLASTIELHSVLGDTEAIRIMEGGGGYYAGLAPRTTSLRGVAKGSGYSSANIPLPDVIAHEIGHNLSLAHAPCGGAGGPDPSFPQRDGSIGAWGFDFRSDVLVPPIAPDLMTYCEPRWISGYNFTKMLNHRVSLGGAATTVAPFQRSLLLWGGLDGEKNLFLDPAIVVPVPAVLPDSEGAHRLVGLAADGRELFSLNFDMPTVADGDGRASFAFSLPADPAWSDALARITLSGPEGSATLDRESDRPVAILLDPAAGRVRGILRYPGGAALAEAAAAEAARAAGLEVLYSRGIPDADAWRR